jgi:hypothetical protein
MTAEEQAVVLVNEVRAEREQELWKGVGDRRGYGIVLEALCRAIERHEAFRQAVSDEVAKQAQTVWDIHCHCGTRHPITFNTLSQFIIPAPKPDPLVDVLLEMELSSDPEESQHDANYLRAKLDALGFEIREKGQ